MGALEVDRREPGRQVGVERRGALQRVAAQDGRAGLVGEVVQAELEGEQLLGALRHVEQRGGVGAQRDAAVPGPAGLAHPRRRGGEQRVVTAVGAHPLVLRADQLEAARLGDPLRAASPSAARAPPRRVPTWRCTTLSPRATASATSASSRRTAEVLASCRSSECGGWWAVSGAPPHGTQHPDRRTLACRGFRGRDFRLWCIGATVWTSAPRCPCCNKSARCSHSSGVAMSEAALASPTRRPIRRSPVASAANAPPRPSKRPTTPGPTTARTSSTTSCSINMGVARSVASRYQHRGIDEDDLLQVAYLALTRAARDFDTERHKDFLSYAVPTIRGELKKHFRDHGWTVRPPRRVQETQARIAAGEAELLQRLGRSPTPSELAAHLGADLDDVIEALGADGCFTPTSLDRPVTRSDDAAAGTLGRPARRGRPGPAGRRGARRARTRRTTVQGARPPDPLPAVLRGLHPAGDRRGDRRDADAGLPADRPDHARPAP